ncbi:MAG: hypothetical protein ACOC0U_00760 [Desulfovibrionales bacterium]
MMPVDFGVISATESAAIKENRIEQALFRSPGSDGFVERFETSLGKIAFLALPAIPGGFPLPNQGFIERVRTIIEEARKGVDLLVAISPWGAQGDRYFLESGPGPIDIFLGSGSGPGINGILQNNGRTFWFRAYEKGKGVTLITLRGLPGSDGWKQGRDIVFKTVLLKDNMREDPEVKKIFQ